MNIVIPNLGSFDALNGMKLLDETSDGRFKVGKQGVLSILATGDGKVEFICFVDNTLALVKSDLGFHAYYPVNEIKENVPVKAVLMDLDGTSVKSEEFWISIIEKTIKKLIDNERFSFSNDDLPFVSGHSVSEHLVYCIRKYCPDKKVVEAKQLYFSITENELKKVVEEDSQCGFTPTEGLKEFLLELKQQHIKIGLVTSGLYSKAYPEIFGAFKRMGLGNPEDFYDCIISAGDRLGKGKCGTLGELEAKPHPWLYEECFNVGMGIQFSERNSVIGIEDSGAGICSVRLSNIMAIGLSGGNIKSSGTLNICNKYCDNLNEILEYIYHRNK